MTLIDPIPTPRRGMVTYAALSGRLTPRDRWILRMLHEHRVFTTTQIAELAFGSYFTASHRLLTLRRLGVVIRWRPYTIGRSAPWHWALGPLGADVVAADTGTTLKELGYSLDKARDIFLSAMLGHQIGTNGVFTALSRRTRGAHKAIRGTTEPTNTPADVTARGTLEEWWPEARCARVWGGIVRPDAYGRWRQRGRAVDFFLEYDNGTETLSRVSNKIEKYAELARVTGITTPVLLWFPTPRREANFRVARVPHPGVPVATTSAPVAALDPAAAVWLPLDLHHRADDDQRIELIDLASPGTRSAGPNRTGSHASDPVPSAWTARPEFTTGSEAA
jgi:hypothetical protein